ncbi:MAG: PepSY domain-containing protein [Gammaproteobacteria bacterium]|nr:PepSY domain-containing protein [Gammaproteobacteria bacterium]
MTRHPKHKSAGRRLRSLYLWHRWIGLTAAAFVIVLSLTGLALNHTGEMALDSRYVESPALLDWYGIRAPDEVTAFRAGPLTIASIGRQVYVDNVLLPNIEPPLAGAVQLDEFVVVALADSLLLLTRAGELVERLGSVAGIPADILSVGVTPDQRLVLQTASGYQATDAGLIDWKRTAPAEVAWSAPVQPEPALVSALQQRYRGTGLSVERVMLDLHSGRILGAWGVWLMDGAAIVFLLLAFSGIWLWGRRRASARAHQRHIRAGGKPQARGQSASPPEVPHAQQGQQTKQ